MKRAIGIIVALLMTVCLFGCSGASKPSENKSENESNLTKTVEYGGLSFSIDQSWAYDTNNKGASIIPTMNSIITINTFINGETESLIGVEDHLLGDPLDYKLEKVWEIDGGTSATQYSLTVVSGSVYTVIVAHNCESNRGFLLFFNRGDKDYKDILSSDVIDDISRTIKFEPSKAIDSSQVQNDSLLEKKSTDTEGSASSDVSVSKKNALRTAKNYLNTMPFSYTGLIEQLEFEKYSTEDATYAADKCGADWNLQAEKMAAQYLDLMGYSRDGLIDQLVFEGFTEEQASHGADAVGL